MNETTTKRGAFRRLLKRLVMRFTSRRATRAEIDAETVTEADIARGMAGMREFMRTHCPDCRKPIIRTDDDAGVCIQCGGRNRRV